MLVCILCFLFEEIRPVLSVNAIDGPSLVNHAMQQSAGPQHKFSPLVLVIALKNSQGPNFCFAIVLTKFTNPNKTFTSGQGRYD